MNESSSRFLQVVILLVIMMVLGGGFYLAGQNKENSLTIITATFTFAGVLANLILNVQTKTEVAGVKKTVDTVHELANGKLLAIEEKLQVALDKNATLTGGDADRAVAASAQVDLDAHAATEAKIAIIETAEQVNVGQQR